MLISFGASNYLSFKEGFEISMELGASCSDANSAGKRTSEVMCIIGANASGKTNVIKSLTYISNFCCNSFNNKPEDSLNIVSFAYNNEPTSFFLEFIMDNLRYYYEVELTNKEIVSERLERKASRKVAVFSRKHNEFEYCINEARELQKMKLRSNVSVISMAHQFEIVALEKIYAFFTGIISNIDPFFGEVKYNGQTQNVFSISKRYSESEEALEYVKSRLSRADTGINDIRIEMLKGPAEEELYFPIFSHATKDGSIEIPYHLESNGTRALYAQLSLYKRVLDQGGVLVLDEFDNNLHPDLLDWLIEFFLDPEINRNSAQIIFSTHNTAFIDKLSKYKIVLVNKEENESFLYRLDELPGNIVRNDRSIENLYKSGKLGGTPNL
ncbi:MAG: ATP-binding protein [Sphaerochaeta sp.]|uniref:AAA family ATPase n=1 Tax=Sphaerochaeta sp. S2 TaxID=2798868 RepID=UPI0018E9BCD1|nr:ATP-binding protein [Sphaerochaeta sp. S2]MCK9348835.1 ATP-binding protein [Sphaerochaeta sp.]MDD4302215.1 ATP-binding protein [Sphaerochaeta sp.]MDD4647540.1 ATP-binding protein [Sphaerochaeta sp.]MDY0243854.1 ATP-binding protein [Sphaerochaeta sp.]